MHIAHQQPLPAAHSPNNSVWHGSTSCSAKEHDSLAYRVAGILLLLYAQPLTKIAALSTAAVTSTDGETRIPLGQEPIPVPQPFADMLDTHIRNRPNLRTTGGVAATPWLFPSSRPGRHLDPQSIMNRLRGLGIDLLGARNTALQNLVVEVPPPLVAELLGYSYNVTQRHAEIAAQPSARYVTSPRQPAQAPHAMPDVDRAP